MISMRRGMLVLAAATSTAGLAWADCGGIPFNPSTRIFEPNQRAVIGFNGREEILLFSTDLRASEPTKVLQVLPLPAEPKVSKGDDSGPLSGFTRDIVTSAEPYSGRVSLARLGLP